MPYDAASAANSLKTAVLLCGELTNLGDGLNLEELRSSLEATSPHIAVEVMPDLCGHLAQLSPVVARQGAVRLVLGLCSGEYSQVELQARVRKTGLDPFGLEVVPLGTWCARVHPRPQATWKAKILLAAAVARARAFQGSGPEHAKPYFLPQNQKISRRSLFTMPPIGYQPVPSIRRERCAAESGCQLCTEACPRDALQKAGRHLLLDKTRCESCGVCLAACPREAIDFPGWSRHQLETQLTVLLNSASSNSTPCALLFVCQRALSQLEELARQGVSYSHHWLPLVLPCLGMATPAWILQALVYGAEAVTLLCCDADCPLAQQRVIGGRVNFCRRLLRQLGQDPGRVRALRVSHPEKLLKALQAPSPRIKINPPDRGGICLGTLKGAFEAIQCLAEAGDAGLEVILEHPHSPFGAIELRAEGCTGCLTCVEVCPTGALAAPPTEDGIALTYTAPLCTGCQMCVDVCPENAAQVLQVRKLTSLAALLRGEVVLHKHQIAACQGCGADIASRALLQRIELLLEKGDATLSTALTRYCPSCRLSFALGISPSSLQPGRE